MTKRVVAVYNDFDTARQVVEALVNAGFDRDDISLVANDSNTEYRQYLEDYDADDDVKPGEGAGFGAVVGTLVGLGVALIPGIGPVIAAGPLAAALMAGIGAAAGAATGGIVASLVDFGIPEEEANIYAENVRRGGTLVAVEVDDNRVGEAQNIMNRYSPIDIEESGRTFRSSGWNEFDANTTDYSPSTTATTGSMYGAGSAASNPTSDMSSTRSGMTSGTTSGSMSGSSSRNMTGDDQARFEVVEEDLQVGKRAVEEGAVRVRSVVTETPVEEQVTLREEHVNVERHPVDRPANSADLNFEEQTIEMTERREEPVVSKVARVVEEVVVGKEVNERTETIRDTVRRKDVEIDNSASGTGMSYRPYTEYESGFRTHFTTNYANSGYTYDQYSPAYRYGYTLATNDRFNRYNDWTQMEPEARRYWEERNPNTWDRFKDTIRDAWYEVTGRK
jgi:uncharacterized protein (TIGR02271 family)